ncbi:hypothetical protein PR048_030771 [Dryococelus australis]|uniref:Uncharacterized protein n=1 Tax=Dryococelus australis TaxID=614101 RepID=A0ABQ9G9U7_9NEOP|nr:hypothetical protein PR048_030771 [Dryococelus australis]
MPSISTNTCINPPLHGHPDALMNPWKIPDCFAGHGGRPHRPPALHTQAHLNVFTNRSIVAVITAAVVFHSNMIQPAGHAILATKGSLPPSRSCILVYASGYAGLEYWIIRAGITVPREIAPRQFSGRLASEIIEVHEHYHYRGRGVVRLLASHLGEPDSLPSGGFLGDIPFPPPLHPGATPYSPRFALIGSQEPGVTSLTILIARSFSNTTRASWRSYKPLCSHPGFDSWRLPTTSHAFFIGFKSGDRVGQSKRECLHSETARRHPPYDQKPAIRRSDPHIGRLVLDYRSRYPRFRFPTFPGISPGKYRDSSLARRRRNAMAGEMGDPRENPLTSFIVHDPNRFAYEIIPLSKRLWDGTFRASLILETLFSCPRAQRVADGKTASQLNALLVEAIPLYTRHSASPVVLHRFLPQAVSEMTNSLFPVSLLAYHQGDPGSIPGRVTPDLRMWESCWRMPLVGGFTRGSPVSPAPSFRRCSILICHPHRPPKISMLRAVQIPSLTDNCLDVNG